MKIINYIAAVLLIAAGMVPTNTQAQSFEKGTKAINLGIGLNGSSRYYSSGYARQGIAPTFLFAMDVGVAELGPGTLGIGGLVGFNTTRSSYYYSYYNRSYDYRSSNLIIGVRANYHWNEWHNNDKLDTYAGVMAGYSIRVSNTNDDPYYNTPGYRTVSTLAYNFPTYNGYVGIRYLFVPAFGVYAEAGFGVTFINGGLTFKF